MSLEILTPGLATTVQDRGRFGYYRFGIPLSAVFFAVDKAD